MSLASSKNTGPASVRIARSNFEYIKKFYPWLDIEKEFTTKETPLSFYYDESNWISIREAISLQTRFAEKTEDPDFAYHASKFGLTPDGLGPWLFHFFKITRTPEQLYRTLIETVPLFNKSFTAQVRTIDSKKSLFEFQDVNTYPQNLDDLVKYQELGFRSIIGYFEAVPTLFGQRQAEVKVLEKGSFGKDFSFRFSCQYEEPKRWPKDWIEKFSHYYDEPSFFLMPFDSKLMAKLKFRIYQAEVSLTVREAQCTLSLLRGRTIKEAAAELSLSPRTVEAYWDTIRTKLNCSSKSEVYDLIMSTLKELNSPPAEA